jgi:peptidoglycan hydrolase-like protein with peptidoglycan-binding domain
MSIKIGHASIDESGKISGGKTGDQTGKEICVRTWYSKPWNVYLEPLDAKLADKAASIMECICADDKYGYDQGQRLTGYNAIVANDGRVHGAKGEFDCSSLVSACYRLAGLNVSPSCTTSSLRVALLATGKFKAYIDKAHLESDRYAKRGGIYLKEGSHVVMALENGRGANPYPEPTRTLKRGDKGEDVKWLQFELGIDTDGSFGSVTDGAVRDYQKKHGLTIDGKCGAKTRQALKA